jgi:hypothetical protein
VIWLLVVGLIGAWLFGSTRRADQLGQVKEERDAERRYSEAKDRADRVVVEHRTTDDAVERLQSGKF